MAKNKFTFVMDASMSPDLLPGDLLEFCDSKPLSGQVVLCIRDETSTPVIARYIGDRDGVTHLRPIGGTQSQQTFAVNGARLYPAVEMRRIFREGFTETPERLGARLMGWLRRKLA
jgi:hypothetical protein